jgi:hypothetical protein
VRNEALRGVRERVGESGAGGDGGSGAGGGRAGGGGVKDLIGRWNSQK